MSCCCNELFIVNFIFSKKIDFFIVYYKLYFRMEYNNIKIKGDKGTKGTKDKNKKTVYSGKHVRKQMEIQNKTNKNTK